MNMRFKDKLKKLRIENGLTQEALADKIHVSRSAIAKYENGNGKPSVETLNLIASFFDIDIHDLKDDQKIENRNKHPKRDLIIFAVFGGLLVILSVLIVILYRKAKFLTSGLNYYSHFVIIFLVILIILGIAFVSIFIFYIIKCKCRKINCAIFLSSIVVSLSICLSGYYIIKNQYKDFTVFTVEKWADAENNHDYRGVMIDSFIDKYNITGYSVEEIEALLGKPDNTAIITLETYPPQYGGQCYIYDLGFYEDYIDPTTFEIMFNYSNHVVNWNKIHH